MLALICWEITLGNQTQKGGAPYCRSGVRAGLTVGMYSQVLTYQTVPQQNRSLHSNTPIVYLVAISKPILNQKVIFKMVVTTPENVFIILALQIAQNSKESLLWAVSCQNTPYTKHVLDSCTLTPAFFKRLKQFNCNGVTMVVSSPVTAEVRTK